MCVLWVSVMRCVRKFGVALCVGVKFGAEVSFVKGLPLSLSYRQYHALRVPVGPTHGGTAGEVL